MTHPRPVSRLKLLVPAIALSALAASVALGPLSARAGEAPEAARGLEHRLENLDKEDAGAAFRLALELEEKGRKDLARKAYEIVIGVQPDHRAARRALGYELVDGTWLKGSELYRARGFMHHAGRWMTNEEFAEATRPERESKAQKAGEARVVRQLAFIASEHAASVNKAKRTLAGIEDRFKLAPYAKALRGEPASLRTFVAGELGRMRNPLAVPALLKRAIYDTDAKVRKAVALALKDIGSPSTLAPLTRALDSRYTDVRVRAAEALGQLGDEAAIPHILYRWEGRSGDFQRVYFMNARQISYIQDFDVEVATSAFIADPIVGVIQEGVVQSVKVLATEQTFHMWEKVAYAGALKNLTGLEHGNDVGAWKKFWKQDGTRLLAEREARYTKLAAERKAARAADAR